MFNLLRKPSGSLQYLRHFSDKVMQSKFLPEETTKILSVLNETDLEGRLRRY